MEKNNRFYIAVWLGSMAAVPILILLSLGLPVLSYFFVGILNFSVPVAILAGVAGSANGIWYTDWPGVTKALLFAGTLLLLCGGGFVTVVFLF